LLRFTQNKQVKQNDRFLRSSFEEIIIVQFIERQMSRIFPPKVLLEKVPLILSLKPLGLQV